MTTDGSKASYNKLNEYPVAQRIGLSPLQRDCDTQGNCPDIFLLPNGNFGMIGADRTEARDFGLPSDGGCGDGERLIEVPRDVFLAAVHQLVGANVTTS